MTEIQTYPEEQAFRTTGPWSTYTIDLVVPFYNEEKNLERTHQINKRLERLFTIKHYLYINNGSKDGTGAGLAALEKSDPRVKIVDVPVNKGYGYGMQQGIKAASADFILTNHADVQFDSYTFFLTHLALLQTLETPRPIFPFRANRPPVDGFISSVLRKIIGFFSGRVISDFNGQPKLLPREKAQEGIDNAPNDFCIDCFLYLKFPREEVVSLPVLQAARLHGVSSWKKSPFARVGQMKRWFKYAVSLGR